MNPIAVNRFVLTKKLFYEGMRKAYMSQHGKTFRNAVIFLIGAWILLTLFTVLMHQLVLFSAVELIIIILLILWLLVYMPTRKARIAFKSLTKRNGQELTRETTFFRDKMEIRTVDGRTVFLYKEIDTILYTAHLIIVIMQDNTGVLIERNSFISGTEEEVLEVLTE